MGRLGDVADILTLGILGVGGYLLYRAWKGVEADVEGILDVIPGLPPEIPHIPGTIKIPGTVVDVPDITTIIEIITEPFPEVGVPWWEMRETRPIGIPGPALRDPSIPSIVDRIADVIQFTPLPPPPDYPAGEIPIGIPGPALRDRDRPSIVDRVLDLVVEPEAQRPWLQVRR